jgi:hypothetical protein
VWSGPCGCQIEMWEGGATATAEKVGAPRCAACFPGKRFDFERHTHLRTLGLPAHPKLTAADVRAALARGGARS